MESRKEGLILCGVVEWIEEEKYEDKNKNYFKISVVYPLPDGKPKRKVVQCKKLPEGLKNGDRVELEVWVKSDSWHILKLSEPGEKKPRRSRDDQYSDRRYRMNRNENYGTGPGLYGDDVRGNYNPANYPY